MNVELRSPGLPLARARVMELSRRVAHAFARLTDRVLRVVLRMRPLQSGTRGGLRACTVEVHMTDGHVERIEERQRRLGPLLRRAVQRAWHATARWIERQGEHRPLLKHTGTPACGRQLPVSMERREAGHD